MAFWAGLFRCEAEALPPDIHSVDKWKIVADKLPNSHHNKDRWLWRAINLTLDQMPMLLNLYI